MWIRNLTQLECATILDGGRLCRLACSLDGRPYVVPIYFAHDDNALFAFAMPGRKIEFMRGNPSVCAQIDEHREGRGWRSVVVDGRYEELPDRIGHKRERDRAWALLSRHADWWEPGALQPVTPPMAERTPHVFFRINIEEMSGREARE